MANNEDLVAMGFTPQEIAQVEALSKRKATHTMYDSTWTMQQNTNWAANEANTRREAAIKDILGNKGGGVGQQRGGTQSGNESFSGIADPEVYAQLKNKLSGMLGGTDADTLRAKQLKEQSINQYDQLLADFSKKGAFTDAAALMQQNLNSAMEDNKPAIQRAIEGSGTSAGSMQALLSQQLADKASLSAGALGAEQAKAYGQISASLMSGRGQLTTGRDTGISDIAQIGDLLKVNKGSAYSNFDPANMMNAQTNRMQFEQNTLNQANALQEAKNAAHHAEVQANLDKINSSGFAGNVDYTAMDARLAKEAADKKAADAKRKTYSSGGGYYTDYSGGWTSYPAGG